MRDMPKQNFYLNDSKINNFGRIDCINKGKKDFCLNSGNEIWQ